MNEEVWKDIIGYEGIYQVSNLGNVRGLDRTFFNAKGKKVGRKGIMLKQHLNRDGYYVVRLNKNSCGKSFSVHRLVAIAFIPNPDNKPQVNHIDGIKTHNNVENLEWVTNRENVIHAVKNGLLVNSDKQREASRINIKKCQENNKKGVVQLDAITGECINIYSSICDANEAVGLKGSDGHIGQVCRGEREFSRGYKWQYYDNYIAGNIIEYKGVSRKYPERRNGVITVGQREEVAELYKAGMKASEIKKKYNISHQVIRMALKENNVTPDKHRGRKYDIDLDVLLQELKDGKTNDELADKYKCPSNLISKRKSQFRKAGILA